jgi:hypothetical protein
MKRIAVVLTIAGLVVLGGGQAESASASVPHFANCTAMHKTYRHGVGRSGARDHVKGATKPVTNFTVSTAIYNANKKMDRDKDGVACEAH